MNTQAQVKHTPGPWFYDTQNYQIQCQHGFLGDPEQETVCTMESSLAPDVTKANANLIAAAPELLDLAIETLRQLNEIIPDVRSATMKAANRDKVENAKQLLEHAIAKAEGRA